MVKMLLIFQDKQNTPTILDFSGSTTGETTVTINGLTGYLNVDEFGNPQRLFV